MAVNINVPSQVKTYANLAAFPATGALKTIYIAEDTNKTYRWTGSVYTEISASAAMTWGDIGGTLSNQTDLQNALDAKVPTSRTLTINGVTQDLSANRTFTISTGITIGSTAIASGVVGRVLFEGAGNVVQESSSLSFDDTAKSFTLSGNQNAVTSLTISNNNTGSSAAISSALLSDTSIGNSLLYGSGRVNNSVNQYNTGASYIIDYQGPVGLNIASTFASGANSGIRFWTAANTNNGVERMRIFSSTGNVGINTTTDAGFRLDVNGTARVQGTFNVKGSNGTIAIDQVAGGNYLYSLNAAASAWRDFTIQTNGVDVLNVLATGRVTIGSKTSATNTLLTLNSGGLNCIESTGNMSFKSCNTFFVEGSNRLQVGSSGSQNEIASIGQNGSGWRNLAFQTNGTTATLFSTGNFAIGTTTDVASAQLNVESTTKGFLPPRMTTTQRNAIASPATGLQVYDTTLNRPCFYDGTTWITL